MSDLSPLFRPRAVAVIGASNKTLSIGNRVMKNLLDFKFTGPVYPVHPKEEEIMGQKVYKSILDVPGEVDLVHIVIKNTWVPQAIEDCGKKGVKAIIINTAGFKEIGGDGIELEKQIVEVAKKYNIRLFGPNCQGVMNTDQDVSVYANFTFAQVRPGHISIVAQSGGVGEVINNRFAELGIGIRMYASNGNACDVSIQEILEYYGDDPLTRVIIVHIEGLDDPASFFEIAKRITKKKPILGMKTGRTEVGAKAVSSHTGSMMGVDITTELMFEKAGILTFRDEEDIINAAIAFSSQPVPKGPRVGVITNTGGPGIIAADELIEAGLSLPDFEDETKNYLRENLFAVASINNPVDVIATAGPKEYGAAINGLLKDPNVDSLMVNFITPFFVDCEGVAREIEKANEGSDKPIVTVLMTDSQRWAKTVKIIHDSGVPYYYFPETASRVLSYMTKYSEILQREEEEPPVLDARTEEAQEIVNSGMEGLMLARDANALLKCYGVPVPEFVVGVEDTGGLNFPMTLKVDSKDVIHKSDEGGVVLDIKDEQTLLEKAKELSDRFPSAELFVQEMVKPDREVIIGAKANGKLGHTIMFGIGGIYVEVLKDVNFKLSPLTRTEAQEMIRSLKGYKILAGTRGSEGVDEEALCDMLLRISQMLTENPHIKELDLNPVIASPSGAVAVDARVIL